MLLVGYNKEEVIVYDPLEGRVTYDREKFFKRYNEMGRYAIVMERKNQ